jgi:hypothetical protein
LARSSLRQTRLTCVERSESSAGMAHSWKWIKLDRKGNGQHRTDKGKTQ